VVVDLAPAQWWMSRRIAAWSWRCSPPRGARPCFQRTVHPRRMGHASWRQTRAITADVTRYVDEMQKYAPPGAPRPKNLSALLSNSLIALFGYRVSHWLFLNGHKRMARLCRS